MKKSAILIAIVCSLFAGASIVTAQAFLSPVIIQDVTANGVALGYFHRAQSVHKWSYTGIPASVPSITGSVMSIPGAVQFGRLADQPTCVSGLRGQFFSVQQPNNGADGGSGGNSDGGIKDLTYQCCKAADGSFSWTAAACQ